MILLPLLLLAQADVVEMPRTLVDGGVCTGLAWVPVPDGAEVFLTEGPDFDVTCVEMDGVTLFGVYTGGHPQVRPAAGEPLVMIEGYTVQAAQPEANFRGYLVGNGEYLRNHFFGNVFTDSEGDRAFFENALFGEEAERRCNPASGADQ